MFLEVVARQVDHRHRRFDCVLGRRSLNRFGNVLLRAIGCHLACFGVEPFEKVGGVVPGVAFNLLEQQFLGFVGRETGDALELVLLLSDEPLVLFRGDLRRLFAVGDSAFADVQLLVQPLGGRLAFHQGGLAPVQ
jgi:hypothetical protein